MEMKNDRHAEDRPRKAWDRYLWLFVDGCGSSRQTADLIRLGPPAAPCGFWGARGWHVPTEAGSLADVLEKA